MKLSPKEKAAQKAAFRALSPAKKAEHIYIYYKWYILLGLAALLILGSTLHRALTKKDPVLYLAFANVAVGSDLEEDLTGDFLLYDGADLRKTEVYLYRDLYLDEDADHLDHAYAYASNVKLMGAIQTQKLDLVLMDRKAYDLLSEKGYLLSLAEPPEGAAPGLWEAMAPFVTENEVVLSDNELEVTLGEAETWERVTERVPNALRVTELETISRAAPDGELYLGLIANSPRQAAALRYLAYLLAP